MAKKITISVLYLIGCVTYVGMAQSSQATMKVSVRVVSGTSIETTQPEMAILTKSVKSNLGNMQLKGIDSGDTLINISSKVLLKDSKGNEIDLDVSSQKRYNKDQTANINFHGSSKEEMKSGSYSGELTTTIHYL